MMRPFFFFLIVWLTKDPTVKNLVHGRLTDLEAQITCLLFDSFIHPCIRQLSRYFYSGVILLVVCLYLY